MQGQATPLLDKPASSALAAVACAQADRRKWPAAMTLAHEIAATRPDAAAEVIVHIVHGLQSSGSSAGHAASGMPLLHNTAHTAGVVQVGTVISISGAYLWPGQADGARCFGAAHHANQQQNAFCKDSID